MQHHRMQPTRAQEVGQAPIGEREFMALLVFPKQDAPCLLIIATMPDVMDDMRSKSHERLLHTFWRDEILDPQVEQASFTRLACGLINRRPLALDIDARVFAKAER